MESSIHTFGLIGKSLSHSFSPKYFTDKFVQEGIDNSQYLVFPLTNIIEFKSLVNEYQLNGLNVTIPYKESILPYLDELSEEAKAIRAVNCISFEKGKLLGHNTDVVGFEKSLSNVRKEFHNNALILGTGGAAKAVVYVLKNLNIPYTVVSRNAKDNILSYKEAESRLSEFPLIINTTPVGTFPTIDKSPLSNLEGIGKEHLVFDLVYNPDKTKLLSMAEEKGAMIKNGLEMLEIQAEESWKIWTS